MTTILNVRLEGASAGLTAPWGDGPRPRGDREIIQGWTPGSAGRLIKWLQSVDGDGLDGFGFAVTLTVGSLPASSDLWTHARNLFLQRLRDMGATRFQWVQEWTARGWPHLHMAVYLPSPHREADLLLAWLDIAAQHGWTVSDRGQHVVPIHDSMGWARYVSKHTARGVQHYQRQGKPPGWERTGRLWGYSRSWPLVAPFRLEAEDSRVFTHYRRLVIAWAVRDAIARGDKGHARRLSKTLDAQYSVGRKLHPVDSFEISRRQGVGIWIPRHLACTLFVAAGHAVSWKYGKGKNMALQTKSIVRGTVMNIAERSGKTKENKDYSIRTVLVVGTTPETAGVLAEVTIPADVTVGIGTDVDWLVSVGVYQNTPQVRFEADRAAAPRASK